MLERGYVLVVQLDEMASNNFVAALREFQWQVSACESPDELLDRLRTQDVDAMVLRGQAEGVPKLIAALRRAAPDAAVVWQAPAASARERVEALEAEGAQGLAADDAVAAEHHVPGRDHEVAPSVDTGNRSWVASS